MWVSCPNQMRATSPTSMPKCNCWNHAATLVYTKSININRLQQASKFSERHSHKNSRLNLTSSVKHTAFESIIMLEVSNETMPIAPYAEEAPISMD